MGYEDVKDQNILVQLTVRIPVLLLPSGLSKHSLSLQ